MCGYDPFYWYDRMLDQEYLDDIESQLEGFKTMDENVFLIEVKGLSESDLKILFDLSFRWHDEEFTKRLKKEFKRRRMSWI